MKLEAISTHDLMAELNRRGALRCPAKALRALLTDECPAAHHPDPLHPLGDPCICEGGRGWLPKPGVTELTLADLTRTKGLFVPLDWLEAHDG